MMERGETLYDIELPGFTLREHGWKVLKYDHGVVLARLIHEKFIEYGTWEPNHDGSLLVSGGLRLRAIGYGGSRGRAGGFHQACEGVGAAALPRD